MELLPEARPKGIRVAVVELDHHLPDAVRIQAVTRIPRAPLPVDTVVGSLHVPSFSSKALLATGDDEDRA
jgi:hypothetical protein